MTEPGNTFRTDIGRFYRHPSARRVISAIGQEVELRDTGPTGPKPSITTIIKMWDEGWIPDHYVKLVATHAVEHIDDLNEVIERKGYAEAIGLLKAIPYAPHPNAAIGDEVHEAIDAHHSGKPIPALTTLTAKRDFAQYLWFLEKLSPEVLRTEYTVWSYAHGYAGTGDALWKLWGKVWAIDYKSGNGIYPKTALQLAASQRADRIIKGGREFPLPGIEELGILHIRPMSVKLYRIDPEAQQAAWEAFLGCKALFDWVRLWKDRAIQQEPLAITRRPKEAK